MDTVNNIFKKMWKDKVVIITGSSMGIGKALAREIGNKGGRIILNSRNKKNLEETQQELIKEKIITSSFAGDVSDYDDCMALTQFAFKSFGKIDVLINNAGVASQGTIEEMLPEVFKKVLEINLLGCVYMTKASIPYLKQTKGSILFIGSIAGIHGIGEYSAYSSSKMALTAIAEALRIELHDSGIHVGIAYVGFTQNDPKKTYMDKHGATLPLPSRKNVTQVPVEKVAKSILRLTEKRKYSSTFTFIGNLNALVNRISPFLVFRILLRNFRKTSNGR